MNTAKTNKKQMAKKTSKQNPFIKLIEDKRKINAAIQSGKSLSTIKGLKFVKPL